MALWERYRRTVFRLCEPLDTGGTFTILTADNPQGVVADAATNRRAERALLAELRPLCRPSRLQGCSPDLSHCENSFAAAISVRQALALARRHRQNAIYRVDEGLLYLVPCLLEDCSEECLGPFAGRVVVA